MLSDIQYNLLKEQLIAGVGCGNDKLTSLLTENYDRIWCISQSAGAKHNPALLSLYTRKGLIELAIGHGRHEIDINTIRGDSTNSSNREEKVRVKGYVNRTGTAEGCAWSSATSFRQFQRDSDSADHSQSHSESQSTSNSFDYFWDRGRSWSNGWAWTFENVRTIIDGSGHGWSNIDGKRLSAGGGGTSDPFDSPTTPQLFTIGSIIPTIHLPKIFPNGFPSTPVISWPEFPNIVSFSGLENAGWPHVNAMSPSPGSPFCVGEIDPETGEVLCTTSPSFGRTASGHLNLSIGIPFAGINVRIDISNASSFNQNHTCTYGATSIESYVRNFLTYTESVRNTTINRGASHDENHRRNDAHSRGESHNQATGSTDAAAAGRSDSRGDSKSESDRTAHTQRRSNGQSVSDWKRGRKIRGTSQTSSITITRAKYWNQIVDSLEMMLRGVKKEIMDFRKTISGRQGFKFVTMPTTVGVYSCGHESVFARTPCNSACQRC